MPRVERQVAMVMDLNKCIGCQTCTIACKTLWTRRKGMEHMLWNTVNTNPGAGTPRGYESMGGGYENGVARRGVLPSKEDWGQPFEMTYDDVFYGGKKGVSLREKEGRSRWGANWDEDVGAGEHPNNHFFYLPRICNHCTHPACLEACPRSAIEKRDEDGIVLINESRCRGYRFCAEACPYKKIYFNEVEGVSQKCIFCAPRLEEGVANACARQCPGRVRFVGFLDDEKGPIHKLVHEYRVALPLHAEWGTAPNVFYVPPMSPRKIDADGNPTDEDRIPPEYLEFLFGPAVHAALARVAAERQKRMNGEESELMDLLIARKWREMLGPFSRSPAEVERVNVANSDASVRVLNPEQRPPRIVTPMERD